MVKDGDESGSEGSAGAPGLVDRRRFIGALGAGAMSGLAGCGAGGDEDTTTAAAEDTTTTTTTTAESTTTTTAGEETTTATTAEGGIERYDVTVIETTGPPAPPDVQYVEYSDAPTPAWAGNGVMDFALIARSVGDLEFYGEVASDWEYRPGLIDLDLHDDWYYWDGGNIDADNVLLHWELENFVAGGEELNAHDSVVRAEKTGDYSLRFSLVDTWREGFALQQSIAPPAAGQWAPNGSTEYYRPWLERFRDASGTSAIESLREELAGTTDKDPSSHSFGPFKLVGAESDKWILRLRTDEDVTPHHVEEINYTSVEIVVNEEEQRRKQMFLDQEAVHSPAPDWDPGELPFDTKQVRFSRPADQWAILFNCSKPPMSDPHFRRAIHYMTDKKTWMRAGEVVPERVHTPFMTPDRERKYVSQEVLDSLEDFGWDEVRREDADREMEAGGYERDSRGRWVYREGDRAGEPMKWTLTTYPWQDHVGNQGTDWQETMAEWGIEFDIEVEEALWGVLASDFSHEISAAYWGGLIPAQVMASNFGEIAAFGAGNPVLPETVRAPPMGEQWPDYDGELETYETATMAKRLAVTQDDAQYREIVDTLTWVFNQTTPRFGIEGTVMEDLINDTKYDVRTPSDAPELWTHQTFRRVWNTGIIEYVPEGQR